MSMYTETVIVSMAIEEHTTVFRPNHSLAFAYHYLPDVNRIDIDFIG